MYLFPCPKLVQIFLLVSSFCRKLTCCFVSGKISAYLSKTLIAWVLLREDPLSMGMLDVFFFSKISYHVALLLGELYILKICQIFNSFYSILPVEVCSLIPSAELSCLQEQAPSLDQEGRFMWDERWNWLNMPYSLHRCTLNQKFISGDVPRHVESVSWSKLD
jgi:hypothetical protein